MSELNGKSNDIKVLTIKFCGLERYKEFKLSAEEYNEFKCEWQKFKGLMSWVTFHPVDFKDRVSINLYHIEMIIWDDRPEDPNFPVKASRLLRALAND